MVDVDSFEAGPWFLANLEGWADSGRGFVEQTTDSFWRVPHNRFSSFLWEPKSEMSSQIMGLFLPGGYE